MAQDHDGNTLSVGDKFWVPCTVTAINNTNQITVTTSYSQTQLQGYVNPQDGHKAGNFPDRP